MSKCDLCGKATDKIAELRMGASYGDRVIEAPYTMPVYCDDCEKHIAAIEEDMKDMEQIRREWQAYRNQL